MSILSRRSDTLSTMSKVGVITVVNNNDEPPLVCVSSDGPMFAVDEVSAMESGYLKSFIESRQFGKVSTEVPSHILEKVVYFIKKLHDEDENIKDLESEFVQQNQHLLLDLMEAAHNLHIESLFDLTCKKVTDLIASKTSEEFREIFNLSLQEMAEMQNYEVWAFKQIM